MGNIYVNSNLFLYGLFVDEINRVLRWCMILLHTQYNCIRVLFYISEVTESQHRIRRHFQFTSNAPDFLIWRHLILGKLIGCSLYFALVSLLILVTLFCSTKPALLHVLLILQTIKSIGKFCRCKCEICYHASEIGIQWIPCKV